DQGHVVEIDDRLPAVASHDHGDPVACLVPDLLRAQYGDLRVVREYEPERLERLTQEQAGKYRGRNDSPSRPWPGTAHECRPPARDGGRCTPGDSVVRRSGSGRRTRRRAG